MGSLWRMMMEGWHAPGRARTLYVVMAAGFGGLAILAGLSGDAAVAALAGLAALATVVVALFAPAIARWMNPPS